LAAKEKAPQLIFISICQLLISYLGAAQLEMKIYPGLPIQTALYSLAQLSFLMH
jgi:hypothetical protein